MDTFILELLVILLMVLLNGVFAASEFAVISIRKSRIAQLVSEGDERAVIVEQIQQDPHKLLALIQIGVTITGATASTVSGIIAVDNLRPLIRQFSGGFVANAAEPIAATTMVILISYLLLVLGELVPKAIGLRYSEQLAMNMAKSLLFLTKACSLAIRFLTASSNTVLGLLHIKDNSDAFISREEIRHIVAEGQESGVFSEDEHEYIRNIFDFTHTCVREVMVPRTRIVALRLDAPREEIIRVALENMYSRYPVFRDNIEDIAGVVHSKDLLGRLVSGCDFSLSEILRHPIFVPEGKKVNDLLKEMQKTRNHMALVVDEYGGLSGLVTTEDLLEELVGEIQDEHDTGEDAENAKMLQDGTLIVDGLMSVSDLSDILEIRIDASVPYDTIAGLILHELGHFPEKDTSIRWNGYTFTCLEVTPTSIRKISVRPETAGSVDVPQAP